MPKNCTVYSDNGNALFEEGNDVLKEIGFETRQIYPPPVHQCLFPNDNHFDRTSKTFWRNNGVDYSDDVDASLLLLQHLDCDITEYIKHW
jgi:hypothetical protein